MEFSPRGVTEGEAALPSFRRPIVRSIQSFVLFAALVLSGTSALAQEHGQMQMEMQPGADRMKVSVVSPGDGSRITGEDVALQVATSGYSNRCDLAGKPVQPGTGHYHVLLDKSLVDMYCTDKATVSLAGLQPGQHTLTVVPAQNDHAEIEHNATTVKIDYQPSSPKTLANRITPTGKPGIKIVSPKPGETVSGSFDVKVSASNFDLACNEMGKPNVPGHGHWHLNFDTMEGPMMGMMTMAGMSCERTLHASTAGLKPGSSHKLIALLADNAHAPIMPAVADSVTVKVQ
jgi:hypothetical protein